MKFNIIIIYIILYMFFLNIGRDIIKGSLEGI